MRLEYLAEVELLAVPPTRVGPHALALRAVRAELPHAAAPRRPERVHQRPLLGRRPGGLFSGVVIFHGGEPTKSIELF